MNRLPELAASDTHSTEVEGAAPCVLDDAALTALAARIRAWGRELGFGAIGISDTDLSDAEAGLAAWLEAGCHGEMDYMAKHGMKRARPAELVAGTRRVISARLAYLPADTIAGDTQDDTSGALAPRDWRARELARLDDPQAAVVSIYARGRDYHKVLRNRLQTLAERIEREIGAFGHRVFTDSAPVLEVELAQKAGIGWRGKHTLLLQRDAGSLFFLGEIYVDIPLPTDAQTAPDAAPETPGAHCGSCTRCIGACPTDAIVAPYRVDARRCISYLTIELKGSIPEPLRPLIGNRVYGCDDCQLVCPWNKFAQAAPVADFDVRHGLDRATLVELFGWSADEFDTRMQGSAIRRIGHECWLRNLAVGLGNALRAPAGRLAPGARDAIVAALRAREDDPSPLVREHVEWALRAA
ncbi:tRNA epoxyqueuosine(34) reductase QueG [Burkholderia stagnalis]|uniref:tRNA epoxyqueuosine(34) reductase QueG n=1 Tax=Burkholderia stagnalis TaxID=1503054 RepID=UPI000F57B9AC|nr:tRNA epoxyqueuosine(34) reductase QueG [Burkholderia stagnalis]RQQ21157.1 tRNA epoxyqueuosine(34) reductase QueG [Burkholderia stagnalis]RQQ23152.1 tRNA epoxyqueuosine(34) reductase QueG [Burkholderia stagnalis]RQQ41811.1 tRNA epoxyqueuosine(34) reductase QueG [Burkholderia stagnalis]RQX87508.1 tRNA epoxyqueuosine(34) reductase QueG [Burkholderia stagnalis]RQY04892.1 tRNA epoxyqueuosine(34) reductase QueG [Burkholderia stagnalis]